MVMMGMDQDLRVFLEELVIECEWPLRLNLERAGKISLGNEWIFMQGIVGASEVLTTWA